MVIFDCDGVLVDSEHLAAEVFSGELERIGFPLSSAECLRRFRGKTLADCFTSLQADITLPLDFRQTLEAATEQAFADQLRPVDGVEEVLRYLKDEGVPFCVATNGGHKKLYNSLSLTGLLHYFCDRRFSADDVIEGKPAPDLFLLAARTLGTAPRFCTVVEDSPVGIAAAQAAGMRPLLFSEIITPDCKVASFLSMADLPALLDLGALR